MAIRRIDHVGIAVEDLDEALAFYRDNFGLVAEHEEINEEQGVREAMLVPAGGGTTTIRVPAGTHDAVWTGPSGTRREPVAAAIVGPDPTEAPVTLAAPTPRAAAEYTSDVVTQAASAWSRYSAGFGPVSVPMRIAGSPAGGRAPAPSGSRG